jgi:hypothetical protein
LYDFIRLAYSQSLFLQKEGEVYKEGAEAPPSWKKGGSRQFFEGLPPKF